MSVSRNNSDFHKPCLCGSGRPYAECCQPFHEGERYPETAEQLMRSRYVAYALHLKGYLLNTWAESTRPVAFQFENGLSWQGLKITRTRKGGSKDKRGWVEFKATCQFGLDQETLCELSEFERDRAGHWVYLDGRFSQE